MIQHLETRLTRRFTKFMTEGRAGLVTFVTAGDPDIKHSCALLEGLPEAGADIIELGIPFSDPMVDGPAIQVSSQRALEAGITVSKILQMVSNFRKKNTDTPIVLMGYFNPVYIYGIKRFLTDSYDAGVDGFIIVDLPPEEEEEFCLPCLKTGLNMIHLTTPTTNDTRLVQILENASGFIYHVSITGITGTISATVKDIKSAVMWLKNQTSLPIAVGFGIKTPQQAIEIACTADAVVVGSALVHEVTKNLETGNPVKAVLKLTKEFAQSVYSARNMKD